jgi:hypothetical protein
MNLVRREGMTITLNRSAIVVKPKQPFLDWLHAADPTNGELTLAVLAEEPTIYLVPEADTDEDVVDILRELCEEIFREQLADWFTDTATWPEDLSFEVFSAAGSTISTIRCWVISANNH